MKRSKATAITLLLIASMLASAVSCQGKTDSGADTAETSAPDSITQSEPLNERDAAVDSVPKDLDFEGKTIRIIYHDDERYARDIISDGENGDVINDAVYARNTAVEERLNVKLEPIAAPTASPSSFSVVNALRTSVASASDDYDIVCSHAIRTAGVVPEGMFLDLYDVKYLDFDKPWWNQNAIEQLSINNKMYITIGDYSTLTLAATYCMFFNKELAASYSLPAEQLYQTVLDGKWTYDEMYKVVQELASDLDGNTQMTDTDQYGLYTTVASPAVAYNWAFGNVLTKKGSDGYPEMNINKELMTEIVEKVYNLCYVNEGTFIGKSGTEDYTMFEEGRALFYNGTFNDAFMLRDLKFSYGIIPYPKLNEQQESYLTMADGFHTVIGIPVTCTETDKVGAALELLNFYSYKHVVPAYYETALKVKYTSDDESMKIMDMILEGRVFDFGYFYDNWKGFAFAIQDLLTSQSSDFASYYASRESSAESYFEEVVDSFRNID